MAADLFFESIHTGKRFKILSLDQEAGTVTLIGEHNAPFDQPYTKEQFEEWGYRLVKADAAPPAPPASTVPPPPAP